MGITVLSSVSTSSARPLPHGGTPAEAAPADFASLLGGQLSSTPGKLMPTKAADALIEQGTSEGNILTPEQLAELAALNPALAAQLLPGMQQNPVKTSVDRDSLLAQGSDPAPANLTSDPEKKTSGAALLSEIAAATTTHAGQTDALASNRLQNQATPLPADLEKQADNRQGGAELTGIKADSALVTDAESAKIAAEPSTASSQPSFAATLHAATAQARAQAAEQASANIPTPIHATHWAQDFGEKIVWLAKNDQQTAQISINPPQLGPMQISINMNGDQASAIFASPHAEVRQAIEEAMPRLREMLSSAGISLGDAHVGAHLPQQNRDDAQQFSNSNPNGAPFANENAILVGDSKTGSSSPIHRGRGLVDLFA